MDPGGRTRISTWAQPPSTPSFSQPRLQAAPPPTPLLCQGVPGQDVSWADVRSHGDCEENQFSPRLVCAPHPRAVCPYLSQEADRVLPRTPRPECSELADTSRMSKS